MRIKTMKHIILLCVAMLALTSCNDYLNIVPKGEKIPTTYEDFESMLRDEYSCQRVDPGQSIILLNDYYVTSMYESYYPFWGANYNWNEDVNRIDLNKDDEGVYYNGYAAVSTFNLILENIPDVPDATAENKQILIAQAKVLRAMSYFYLVNYYADQYEESTAYEKGGVPYITSADVNAPYVQESVGNIYDYMLQDMKEAIPFLPEQSVTKLHPDLATGYAFYAQIYLQLGRYQDALNSAEEALKRNDELFDWCEYYNANKETIERENYYPNLSAPCSFDFVENYNFRHGTSSYAGREKNVTTWRSERFEEGDWRFASRWKYREVGADIYYYALQSGYHNYGGLTTTHVYLIKAECLARLNRIPEAMAIVNKIRDKRIAPNLYTPWNASAEKDAIEQIVNLKLNEMILTQVPFCDLRRLNSEGKYTFTFTKEKDESTLSLKPDSHLWTMPFPLGAIKNSGNGSISQNVSK